MTLPLLLASLLSAAAPAPPDTVAAPATLRPDTLFETPRGVRVALLQTPGAGTVGLRLHAHLRGDEGLDGGGHLLRILAEGRGLPLAERAGFRFDVSRESTGLVYRIAGARADLPALVEVLHRVAAPPDPAPAELRTALEELARGRAVRAETPGQRLRSRLRDRLSLGPARPWGPPDRAPEGSVLRDVWRSGHRAGRLTLTVAGSVDAATLSALLEGLPADAPDKRDEARGDSETPDDAGRVSGVQTLRVWQGRARSLRPDQLPAALVAVRVARRHLAGAGGPASVEATAELWRGADGPALAVVAAAYPERADAAEALLAEIPELDVRAAEVQSIADVVAFELLREARSPGGMADAVGRDLDPGQTGFGSSDGAAALLDGLARLEADDVRRALTGLGPGSVAAVVHP